MNLSRISVWAVVIVFALCTYVPARTLFAQQIASTPATNSGVPQGAGGAAQADFDTLIDLIQTTVAYDSWMENGTGEGEISPFAINGVYADARGTLKFSQAERLSTDLLADSAKKATRKSSDVRRSSPLRFVSLPRLEKAIEAHLQSKQPLPSEMLTLAGLQRAEYLLINIEANDLILAGPAGDWQIGPEGALVSVESGRAVLRLDDLLTLWRRGSTAPFGCSIVPRQAALAATQQYLNASAGKPLEPSQRKNWLTGLRASLASQDVEFFGIEPTSHAAMVLLVADYHMKLIGMGLTESVPGVTSYLDTVELSADGSAPPMSVLRWWFAMNHEPVKVDAERKVFHLPENGVQVLSENELLTIRGERVHTNQSDDLNRRFATSFTAAFSSIAEKYPLYGELANLFDLALVLAILEKQQLMQRIEWQPQLLLDSTLLPLPTLRLPREVETVVNHRVINRRHIIAGISGGVWIDGRQSLELADTSDGATLRVPAPQDDDWWWNAE